MKSFFYQVFLFFQGIIIDIYSLVKGVNIFSVILCFIICFLIIWAFDKQVSKRISIFFVIVSSIYMTFLFSITLLGREPVMKSSIDGLFYTYIKAAQGDFGMQLDILFNIFLYIPVGLLIARYRNTKANIIFLLLLPTTIEFIQLITSRGIFEISDIINNFIGGFFGLSLARMISNIHIKRNIRKGGKVGRARKSFKNNCFTTESSR